jgi:hemerythrin-like domain-containing protein
MSKYDILSLLELEHKELRSLIQEIIATAEQQKKVLPARVAKLTQLLDSHLKIEDQLLYANIAPEWQISNQIQDTQHKHQEIQSHLHQLQVHCSPVEVSHHGKELLILIERHIKDQENNLFPPLKPMLEPETLSALGQHMVTLKEHQFAGR